MSEQVSVKLGMSPKISEVIEALNEIKEKIGDVPCGISYDCMDVEIEFHGSTILWLFMS